MEAVAHTRRAATNDSNASSVGRANSSRKNGWRERFSDGDGERIAWGQGPDVSNPSVSCRRCVSTAVGNVRQEGDGSYRALQCLEVVTSP